MTVMATAIPIQNRNAAVATGNMTKLMAINLKIPKLALPPNSRTNPHIAPASIKAIKKDKYDISSAFDDWTVGGRSFKFARIADGWEVVDAFPGAWGIQDASPRLRGMAGHSPGVRSSLPRPRCSRSGRVVRAKFGSRRPYSITSSAMASSVGGMSRPSARAVIRLITRSNLVGCSTGRSAGLAPRSTLST
jgi:hypothetical protein